MQQLFFEGGHKSGYVQVGEEQALGVQEIPNPRNVALRVQQSICVVVKHVLPEQQAPDEYVSEGGGGGGCAKHLAQLQCTLLPQ